MLSFAFISSFIKALDKPKISISMCFKIVIHIHYSVKHQKYSHGIMREYLLSKI